MVRKVLAVLLLLVCFRATAEEQRCTELGSVCVCSEPLNVNQSWPADTFIDPSDSTTKPCPGQGNNNKSVYLKNGGASVSAFGFPSGSSVQWVLRVDGGGIANITGQDMAFSVGTLCVRLYQRFSTDFPVPLDPMRAKLQELSEANLLHQMQWDPFDVDGRGRVEVVGFDVSQNVPYTGQEVILSDCQSSWCRMEICIEKPDSSTFFAKARIVVLDTGKTMDFTSNTGNANTINITTPWIGNLFRQNSSQGFRYVSYGMQAYWPSGTGQWIGPASEIEGSGGGQPARKHLRGGGFSGGALK